VMTFSRRSLRYHADPRRVCTCVPSAVACFQKRESIGTRGGEVSDRVGVNAEWADVTGISVVTAS
jgi:hypothetical protein